MRTASQNLVNLRRVRGRRLDGRTAQHLLLLFLLCFAGLLPGGCVAWGGRAQDERATVVYGGVFGGFLRP